eukprot:g34115.t1
MGNKEMVEEPGKHFASVFMVEDTRTDQNIKRVRGQRAITKDKVLGKLKGLKLDKPSRPDRLHPRVLKQKAEELEEALVVIFQESLESRRVLEDWEMAN